MQRTVKYATAPKDKLLIIFLYYALYLTRTPDWTEPIAPVTRQSGRESVLDPELTSICKPLSNIYIGEPVRGTSSSTQAKAKTKAKTRDATSNTTDAPSATTVALIYPEPESASIPIDSRFLKVFRTLFFNPAVTSSPGEVPWNDFLHAMTSTGLFGAEKLYGSVWQF